MINSHFAGGILEQGDMQKRQFPKDGIRMFYIWLYNNLVSFIFKQSCKFEKMCLRVFVLRLTINYCLVSCVLGIKGSKCIYDRQQG